MKIKFSKILFILFLLIAPVMFCQNNVNAFDCLRVSPYKINLSKENMSNPNYLNSPGMKAYLVKRMKKCSYLNQQSLEYIESNLNYADFFCINSCIFDSSGRVILHIWVPNDIENIHKCKGMLCFVIVDYKQNHKTLVI